MSMIVIVPFYKETLSSVVNRLSKGSIRRILNQLSREQEAGDVVVYLPKFKISSNVVLNEILYSMGMEEVFVPGAAELGGISPDELFASYFFHKAEIEVDEEGTTGTAAAVGGVIAISAPPTFSIDRPFVYVIYDKGGKVSMVVILPKRKVTLASVLKALAEVPLQTIIDGLYKNVDVDDDNLVIVDLPKFKISSHLTLRVILKAMGIQQAFRLETADFKDICNATLCISRVLHKAEIEVDEEGTVASASTIVESTDRIYPAVFRANQPFAFVIYDKHSKSIVFTGIYRNPESD